MAQVAMLLQPGDRFDRYTVEELVGEGGMGKVYRAFDERLHRRVALKVLEPVEGDDAPAAIETVLREARAAAAIAHPNAMAVFDAHEVDGAAFLVMEFVPGTSLRQIVGDPSVPLTTRIRWLMDIAGALSAAHQVGVIHRDIKPENVIVRDDGMIKVLDFGVARVPRQQDPDASTGFHITTRGSGLLIGTPAYMAPEYVRGDAVDERLDQFAWGVVAYELLTGRLPWKKAGHVMAYLAAVMTEEPPPPSSVIRGIPLSVETVVQRALAKAPGDRFASMNEAIAALSPFASAPLSPPPESMRRNSPASGPISAARPIGDDPPSRGTAPSSRGTAPSSARPVPSPRPSSPHFPASRRSSGQIQAAGVPSPPPSRSPSQEGRAAHPTLRTPVVAAGPVQIASAPPPPEHAPASSQRRPAMLHDPDFEAPVDVEAHARLLPPDATCKGMFFLDLLKLVQHRSPADLALSAGVPDRRYLAFRDYPMADYLRLAAVVAAAAHGRLPLGEGLRRIGWTVFDTVIATQIGRTLFGIFGSDAEALLGSWPKAFKVLYSFGHITSEKVGPRAFVFEIDEFPAFLETYHVGVLQGLLRHCGERAIIRIALPDLAGARIEVELL
ncbi:MAG: DUF2378 family protein [Byssovorax sp.]